MKKIVVYGIGAYTKIFFSDAERHGSVDIAAFTVDSNYIDVNTLYDLPVVPFEKIENSYSPKEFEMIVLCGYGIMRNRKTMYDKAKAKGYTLANYISPRAYLESDIVMGENNIIYANTVIGYDGIMGNNNLIRSNVYLGHEFCLHNHTVISSGCTLGGGCVIEDLAFLGMGTSAKGRTVFEKECLVGLGSVVTKNIESYSKNYGNPARCVGYHKDTGVIIKERL